MGIYEPIGFFAAMTGFGLLTIGATKRELNIPRHNNKYYPKKYMIPHRKVRKLLHLKKMEVPKGMYIELFIPLIYVILFIAFTLTYINTYDYDKLEVMDLFFRLYGLVMGIQGVHFIWCSIVYK